MFGWCPQLNIASSCSYMTWAAISWRETQTCPPAAVLAFHLLDEPDLNYAEVSLSKAVTPCLAISHSQTYCRVYLYTTICTTICRESWTLLLHRLLNQNELWTKSVQPLYASKTQFKLSLLNFHCCLHDSLVGRGTKIKKK